MLKKNQHAIQTHSPLPDISCISHRFHDNHFMIRKAATCIQLCIVNLIIREKGIGDCELNPYGVTTILDPKEQNWPCSVGGMWI